MIISFSDFIYIADGTLEPEFCKNVIEKFEKDDRKYQGTTGGGVDLDIKRSLDLFISDHSDWKSFDDVFFKSLNKNLNEYWKQLPTIFKGGERVKKLENDTGYQIQKTQPGDFYTWHNDASNDEDGNSRVVTFIWYLNDITEGGETVFINKCKIKPKKGSLLIFPATWTYPHCGMVPKSHDKYIVTGWMYTSLNNIDFR